VIFVKLKMDLLKNKVPETPAKEGDGKPPAIALLEAIMKKKLQASKSKCHTPSSYPIR
jgi:hypothetical protein